MCVSVKRFLRLIAVGEAVGLRFRPVLTHSRVLQRAIGRRHILMDMHGRDAQRLCVVAEPVSKIVFRQEILKWRVDIEQITHRVFVLQPVQTPDSHASRGEMLFGRLGQLLLRGK